MKKLLFATLLAACGGNDASTPDAPLGPAPDAMPREVVNEDVLLVVNEIVEAKLVGGPGDSARVRMTAGGAPIDWNIHGHENGETQIIQEGLKVPSVDYLFTPTSQTDWYLLIRNKGQTDITVDIDIELYGDIAWSGWI